MANTGTVSKDYYYQELMKRLDRLEQALEELKSVIELLLKERGVNIRL